MNIPFLRILHISEYSIFHNMPYSDLYYSPKYGGKVLWHKTTFSLYFAVFQIFHISEYSIFKNIPYFRIFHIPKYSIFWNMLYSKIWKKGFVTYNKLFRYTLPFFKYSIFKNIPYSRIFKIQNIPYSEIFYILNYER